MSSKAMANGGAVVKENLTIGAIAYEEQRLQQVA